MDLGRVTTGGPTQSTSIGAFMFLELLGIGTSDKIVSVAPEGVNEDKRLFRDLVDPQTPYTSCLSSTDQLSAQQRQKAFRTNNARLRSGEQIVGLLEVETLWSIYSVGLPDWDFELSHRLWNCLASAGLCTATRNQGRTV